jgi:hypothetical protein
MLLRRRMRDSPRFDRRCLAIVSCLGLCLANPLVGATLACDPPGPPPRFACQWSTDVCDWVCPVCDPFGTPPRSGCTWDGAICNWVCPGYTGTEVTVRTLQPPARDATVYVRLRSLCTATGVIASCSGGFAVYPGMPVSQKCQAIADAIANDCSAAGYGVTVNDCGLEASLTAANLGCPATPFALGLSNDPGVFDQAGQGPLPDGESDNTTGTTDSCDPMPGPAGNLRLATLNDGQEVQLTWDDAANADDYVVFVDTAPNGSFSSVTGTAPSGTPGLTVHTPPGIEFYLVAGRNSACGVGPKH